MATDFTEGYMGHRTYSWSQLDASYDGPHMRKPAALFEAHVSGYAGHRPINWNPHARRHLPDKRSSTLPPPRRLPRAAGTAGGSFWFGELAQFPKAGL
mmetsp:Transcript_65207/g.142058  ORF Transcript_65207/g.142058 Transcript_65207/m.142058 type:complete len:98 (-) Transcript_65207:121-414(-)|eukprot:CAMPEP_0170614936 /NCGR_PEP_ID=MMETSP0224-20130122/25068_1 /TAXON_ID=285029 /ORGANISM="Togula jolla, Strain CCCM 725" /LENGTH=97 /DNA_ID=CAMNT_0010940631 /DNA_START=41 /DNA_END=334 /DNA_ORIENTATION=+